jgi:hypothetical protein
VKLFFGTAPVLAAGLAWLASSSTADEGAARIASGDSRARTPTAVEIPHSYAGPGSAAVFSDGTCVFTCDAAASSDAPTSGFAIPLADPAGVDLVRRGRTWSLAEAAALPASDERIPIDVAATSARLLLVVEGPMAVTHDGARDEWRIAVADRDSGRRFVYGYRPARDGDVSTSRARVAALADCSSGPCTNGSCSITCNPPLMCMAGCTPEGDPFCRCVSFQPVERRPLPGIGVSARENRNR